MQIVIDIPEVFYETLRKADAIISGQRSGKTLMSVIFDAVTNGTPLPKGHGRLIDADELFWDIQTDEQMRLGEHLAWIKERIDNAPTIIEAESEDEE